MMKNKYLTSAMAAEIMNISPAYVRRLILDGKIKAEKMGHDWILRTIDIKKFARTRINKKKESENGCESDIN